MGTTADKLAYLQGAKEAIREAIESLGGTVPDGLPFRQYASRIRNLAINSLDVPEGDVQVTCRISPTGQIRVEGPFAYPLSDTYYLNCRNWEICAARKVQSSRSPRFRVGEMFMCRVGWSHLVHPLTAAGYTG